VRLGYVLPRTADLRGVRRANLRKIIWNVAAAKFCLEILCVLKPNDLPPN